MLPAARHVRYPVPPRRGEQHAHIEGDVEAMDPTGGLVVDSRPKGAAGQCQQPKAVPTSSTNSAVGCNKRSALHRMFCHPAQ